MAIGWFDFFREDGAPTWYGENRTPVVVDLKIAIILSIFVIPTLAFLIILPGIRRNRCVSTFTFLYSMAVGATLLVTIHHPCWHQGKVHIYSLYRKDSSARLDAVMGVSVGLHHVNITFTSSSSLDADAIDAVDYDRPANPPPLNLNYNERFEFSDVRSMERELELSMKKGLPYPILRVIEYLSVDRAGFVWGRQYRLAGYYASILLWVAFSCWLLQFLLLCIVPHQYAQMTVWVGAVILLADLVYAINTPNHLHIRFPGPRNEIAELDFHFSTCFYSTLIAVEHIFRVHDVPLLRTGRDVRGTEDPSEYGRFPDAYGVVVRWLRPYHSDGDVRGGEHPVAGLRGVVPIDDQLEQSAAQKQKFTSVPSTPPN
uniref:Dual oxidase maturation factor 2 n=1 Tax=Steinernema glaseri TaxID=37863 RepID=A0A1I7Y668_9BILA